MRKRRNMLDVLLINSPILLDKTDFAVGDESWCPPLGLMYISSFLKKYGFKIKLLDVRPMNMDLNDILTVIDNERPRVIGISALTASIRSAVEMAKVIKQKYKDKVHICLGGSHISADPGVFERFPFFDSAVIQEGEITFKKIVERVLAGENVKGVFKGEIYDNLDDLPPPDRDLLQGINYRERRVFLLTSRGCPYRCLFCCLPAIPRKVRYRSAESVVAEISSVEKKWRGHLYFVDDTFTLNRKRVVDICRKIIDKNMKLSWIANTRVDLVDKDLLKLMARAGCEELAFGVESGSQRIRNGVIDKKIEDREIAEAVYWCKKNKIRATFYLMLGFPTETPQDIKKTVQCGSKFGASIIGVHPAVPMPGSKLFEVAIEEGKLKPDIIDSYIKGEMGRGFRGVWPIYVPDGLTEGYIHNMQKRAYYKFYLRPSFLIKRFFYSLRSPQQLKADIRILINLLRYGRTDTSIT